MSQLSTTFRSAPIGTDQGGLVARLFETLIRWQERASERHHLAQLSDRNLRDIGLSRADADLEADKPFWRQ